MLVRGPSHNLKTAPVTSYNIFKRNHAKKKKKTKIIAIIIYIYFY